MRAFVTALLHCMKRVLMNILSVEQQQGEAVEMPRNRENHSAASFEEYYRRRMYFPYLDVSLKKLRERIIAHSATVHGLSGLLPAYVINADVSNLRAAVKAYKCFLP